MKKYWRLQMVKTFLENFKLCNRLQVLTLAKFKLQHFGQRGSNECWEWIPRRVHCWKFDLNTFEDYEIFLEKRPSDRGNSK